MRRFPARVPARLLGLIGALALAGASLGACSSAEDPGGSGAAGGCDTLEHLGTFDDTVVTVSSALSDSEAERFEASLATFEECTGIDVVHTGSSSMETELLEGTTGSASVAGQEEGQELPDLAIVPQPGLVAELAEAGVLVALPDQVNANIEIGWNRQWAQIGTYDGTAYAAPLMASVKSFIWYSPVAFAESGYEVPRSWADLEALTEQVVEDHPDGVVTPWCLGLADGESTGWTMTDWLEDTMLATQGPGPYDTWASHQSALDDPSAVRALTAVDDLVLADGHVDGGRQAAAARSVEEAGSALLEGRCLMLHASSSFETMLPEGTMVTDADGDSPVAYSTPRDTEDVGSTGDAGSAEVPSQVPSPAASPTASSASTTVRTGAAVSAFLTPSADRSAAPVLVGSDYLVALAQGEAQAALMDYLTSAHWAQERASLGGVATAHQGVDASQIPSDVAQRATTLLQSRETTVRMDASDSMPAVVGAGALWTDLTRWTTGELSPKEALSSAEKSWPREG
ncbi:carbohydrate ABC transporter substrate-binding protein [Actinomyces sp. 2119]|uniref:Carbohydrate ABC transporter substrate-binding protein n=1 Tax=Actinomyces lilanjuaniae TaxID=2321394 RepID=A0ABN5PL75_9ACTO|nr:MULTISPECIES: ABC transporter substrate-binding protein [Actinomyces]AYD88935.1 carbohydrate ABC transporter substrate-binding protein [Actinomyces lilanjuaniae]RJF41227.1 carbohydrate ABC transporter substrate-binding protein [Actinomyces sp. 2119]